MFSSCVALTFLSLPISCLSVSLFFFFNDPSTPEFYTLSLHDALPILARAVLVVLPSGIAEVPQSEEKLHYGASSGRFGRSEEHTSELQSRGHLVCRLLLEKKKGTIPT